MSWAPFLLPLLHALSLTPSAAAQTECQSGWQPPTSWNLLACQPKGLCRRDWIRGGCVAREPPFLEKPASEKGKLVTIWVVSTIACILGFGLGSFLPQRRAARLGAVPNGTSIRSPSLGGTIFRLLFRRGTRQPGVMTGIFFPISVRDLAGPRGPDFLTTMLRAGGHLKNGMRVSSVRTRAVTITDGVKGDKAVIDVEYDSPTTLPTEFFVKFNLQRLGAMRLLCDLSDVCRCEVLFYHKLAPISTLKAPTCYFADYSDVSGECVLLTELIKFGEADRDSGGGGENGGGSGGGGDDGSGGGKSRSDGVGICDDCGRSQTDARISGTNILVRAAQAVRAALEMAFRGVEAGRAVRLAPPEGAGSGAPALVVEQLRHRVRDATTLEEQRLFVRRGAQLNASFWVGSSASPPILDSMPRFDETHKGLWRLCQITGRLGLAKTARRELKGENFVHHPFMAWSPPDEIVGKERQLIADMPLILADLCKPCRPCPLLAFGHNDLVTDNAFFHRDAAGVLDFGAFDWQQSCVNNVAQEWAWNFHFLEPSFLTAHEDEFIDLILKTYRDHGITHVTKPDFLNDYCLGTVQMYVWGGGGLQLLLGDLKKRGIFESMVPNDPRCRGNGSLDAQTLEKLVGAEMTRRTFTNCCNVMRRHGFYQKWQRWRIERGLEPV